VLARYMTVAELDPSTRITYAGYIRRTILPALGSMELRKVRGPLLDTFYERLRRCGELTCTGRPFIEHRSFPDLTIEPGDSRSAGRRASAAIRDAASSGQLAPGEQLPSVRELAGDGSDVPRAMPRGCRHAAGRPVAARGWGRVSGPRCVLERGHGSAER
jgi:Phage integrase, N-terminal SAM-like domain/Bacterial regulatory proteins, gntR family